MECWTMVGWNVVWMDEWMYGFAHVIVLLVYPVSCLLYHSVSRLADETLLIGLGIDSDTCGPLLPAYFLVCS